MLKNHLNKLNIILYTLIIILIPNNMFAEKEYKTESGLIIQTTTAGEGTETAKKGDTVSVHYTGKFTNGDAFDSSLQRDPLVITLGYNQVIKGFEEGISGMKINEERTITIPPELGYGNIENGPIPANSTLIFEIKLVDINGTS